MHMTCVSGSILYVNRISLGIYLTKGQLLWVNSHECLVIPSSVENIVVKSEKREEFIIVLKLFAEAGMRKRLQKIYIKQYSLFFL